MLHKNFSMLLRHAKTPRGPAWIIQLLMVAIYTMGFDFKKAHGKENLFLPWYMYGVIFEIILFFFTF